ncbi:hypothetical protein ES703_105148 [subsurface metagenome]
MKIGKAIQLLILKSKGSPDIDPDDLSSASQLGLEALRVIQTFRRGGTHNLNSLLPGETPP